jgi:quercetin 2,3-dioxygenase
MLSRRTLLMGAAPAAAAVAVAGTRGADDIKFVDGKLPGRKQAYRLRDGEGLYYLLGGQVATIIARKEDTGGLFEAAILAGGKGAALPPHRHERSHEAVLALDGEVEMRIGESVHLLSRGDYASIPPGVIHGHTMRSHRTRLLTWTMGAEAGALYAALGESFPRSVQPPVAPGPISDERFTRAEAEVDVRFAHGDRKGGDAVPAEGGTVPEGKLPFVLESGEGQRLLAGDQLYSFLGHRGNSDGQFITLTTEGPPGPRVPDHYHEKHTENFFCLDGRMTMWADGAEMPLLPGDFLHVPAGTVHGFRLDAPYTRFVGFLTPGLFEPFFRYMGEPCEGHVFPVKPGRSRFDRVLKHMAELDLKFVGGPFGNRK